MRRLVRPCKISGVLPHGPLPEEGAQDWMPAEVGSSEDLAWAIDNWYRAARRSLGSLVCRAVPHFRPKFRWEPAAGRLACKYAGATALSTAWRELATRAFEAAAIYVPHTGQASLRGIY